MFTCPRCREDTVSYKDKYLADLWRTIKCPRCGARLTAYPVILLIMHMLYVWNVMWFLGMFMLNEPLYDPMWFVYMAVVWVILDFLTLQLVPLAALREPTS